jgi:hypothetical protein
MGGWDFKPVKTPLKPGQRLSLKDCPTRGGPSVTQKVSNDCRVPLVPCPDYATLLGVSLLLACLLLPLQALQQHVRCLRVPYLGRKYDIAYGDPREGERNLLDGWVDSDFAADPDTRSFGMWCS